MMFSTLRNIVSYVVAVLIAIGPVFMSAQNSSDLLSAAIYEEEINGNLSDAIKIYEQLISVDASPRSIAAEALLRLGITHEKLGRTKARQYYRKLVEEYTDQSEFVTQARKRLALFQTEAQQNPGTSLGSFDLPSRNMMKTRKVYFPGIAIRSISPDGRYFSYGGPLGNLTIYDRMSEDILKLTPDPEEKFHGRSLGAKGISTSSVWSPDSKKIAYTWVRKDEGDDLRIYDMENNEISILCPYTGISAPRPMQWTKDGKYILGEIRDKELGEHNIVLIGVDDCTIRVIKNLPSNPKRGLFAKASLSEDNQYLLYEDLNESDKYDIFIKSIDTGVDKYLFGNKHSNERSPLWIEGGNSMLFFSDQSKSTALWKATMRPNLAINEAQPIIDGVGWSYYHLGFTSSGEYFYFSHGRVMNLYTGPLKTIFTSPSEENLISSEDLGQRFAPSWSIDGSKLAYVRVNNDGNDHIEIKDLTKRGEYRLPLILQPGQRHTYQAPSWSPDGDKLLLCIRNSSIKGGASYFSGNVFQIIEVDIESGQQRTVVNEGSHPVYGLQDDIYFKRNKAIIRQKLDGYMEQKVYDDPDFHISKPTLSPGGNTLAFVRGKIDQRPNDQLVLLNLLDSSLQILWQLETTDQFYGHVDWSDDGQTLLLSTKPKNAWEQQVILFDVLSREIKPLGNPIIGREHLLKMMDYNINNQRLVYCLGSSTFNLWSVENY